MTYLRIRQFHGCEDTPHVCLARINGYGATPITKASIASITCKVFDLSGATPDTASSTPAVVVSSAVYDALQTDDQWGDEDETGYNFAYTVPATSFPLGDHYYLIEFMFTPTSGEAFPARFTVYAAPLRGS